MGITKNTTIIFLDGKDKRVEELAGGIPLSKGDVVRVHDDNTSTILDYKVVDKNVDCFLKKKDALVNIAYTLRRK